MLKILFNPKKAERHPFETFFLGFVYSSISMFFALWIFHEYVSIAMIFLTVFACIYLIQGAIKMEEKKEVDYKKEGWLLKEHSKLVILILALFLGFIFSFTVWSFILPTEKVAQIFVSQDSAVEGIRASITTGNFTKFEAFSLILINNLKVLLISLVFALFYGAGAIYILVWNASVMGFVIGTLAKKTLGVTALPLAFSKYLIHGIPEMLAYLIAAIAGGIIFTSLIKGDILQEGRRKGLLIDAGILVIIAIGVLIISALIETHISPLI